MAKAPVVKAPVNLDPNGNEIKEYPKLVKTEKGKVLVNSAEEEAALNAPASGNAWKA